MDNKRKNTIIVGDETQCCGCGVCENVCPKKAIRMVQDVYGFTYPMINQAKCINCGLCRRVCAYQNPIRLSSPKQVYAAAMVGSENILKSTSGGVFAALAEEVLNYNGVVVGCSLEKEGSNLMPRHIMVDNIKDLPKLQGSKYVKSEMGQTYIQVKTALQAGKVVLFSGTPCQVASLKTSLFNVNCEKLFTLDIICHGVPNSKFFQDYLVFFEKKLKGTINYFSFRDKTQGWGLKGRIQYTDRNNVVKTKILPIQLSSYYQLFLDGVTYRENCYSCKYARKERSGDLTNGDYWGVEKTHPEYLEANGGMLSPYKGISCILVNNEQGQLLLNRFGSGLGMTKSDFESVAQWNEQLKHASPRKCERDEIMELYKNSGYAAVDTWYYRKLGWKKYVYIFWNMIPLRVQKMIKNTIERMGK